MEHICAHREFITHTGYVGNKRISVLSTGIGPDNIDIALNEVDALVNIDFETRTIKEQKKSVAIIRMGTCGSLQGEVGVDQLVAGTHGLGIDNLLHFYNLQNNEEEKGILAAFESHTQINSHKVFPYIASASAALIKHFTQGYNHGITVTCPGFYAPQGREVRLKPRFDQLIERLAALQIKGRSLTNFEMETAGYYALGELLGHEVLSLNAILANRPLKKFDSAGEATVSKAIQLALTTFCP